MQAELACGISWPGFITSGFWDPGTTTLVGRHTNSDHLTLTLAMIVVSQKPCSAFKAC
jgi:hypothetical protein